MKRKSFVAYGYYLCFILSMICALEAAYKHNFSAALGWFVSIVFIITSLIREIIDNREDK